MIEYRTHFDAPVVFWKALMKSWQDFGRNQRRDSFMISVETGIQEIFSRKKIFLSTSKIESWMLARTLRRFHPRNCHWSCVGWSHTPTHTLTPIQRRSRVLGSSREGSSTSALLDRKKCPDSARYLLHWDLPVWRTLLPTALQRRSLCLVLKHYFVSKKSLITWS